MLTLLALLWTPSALALNCEEIMSMVNVNVPVGIVVQTIDESGGKFSSDDVRCLQNEGAPAEIVSAVKAIMSRSAAPPPEEPSEEAEEAPKTEYERTETLGGGSRSSSSRSTNSGGGKRSLEDEGGEEAEEGRDPEKLEDAVKAFKAKKPLQSSILLWEMLKEGSYPDSEAKITYYLAQSLMDLKLYHAAQYYYIEVLKKGPSNPYFKYALPKLVSIAKATGDDSDLARIVGKIPAEEYPRQARNQLYYLYGVRAFERESLTEARKAFGQVSEKSDLYTRSKYFDGVIAVKQGRLKSAVKAFQEVVKSEVEAQTLQEKEAADRLAHLSLLNIARIYYSIEDFKQAQRYYDLVPRDSRYWPESLFENAWTSFMLSDPNLVLGQVLTINSPFFNEDEFIPEGRVLRALTFFNLCEYDEVDALLADFDQTYRPMHAEMRDLLKQYGSDEGKKLADEAFDKFFGKKPADTSLPRSVFVRMLRNQEFAGLVAHLDMMDAERDLIAEQKTQWKESIGEDLQKIIAADRDRLKRRAGLVMLQELATASNHIGDLLGQADIIKFELADRERLKFQRAASGIDIADTSSRDAIGFGTSSDRIYWPFNGEFWQDELGYYVYTEQGSCTSN